MRKSEKDPSEFKKVIFVIYILCYFVTGCRLLALSLSHDGGRYHIETSDNCDNY